MIYIYHGEDEFSLQEELAALKAGLDDDGMLVNNTSRLEGGKLQPAEILGPCSTIPFMGSHRLVIVEGLLERFEGSRGKEKKRESVTPWKTLPAALQELPPTTTLVFVDGKIGPGNSILRLLSPLAEVREFRPIRQRAVPDWIGQRARDMGLTVSPAAVALLADLIGNDLRALAQELGKLGMYAQERPISDEDVRLLVSASREASVLTMVDAIVEGRSAVAIRLLEQLQNEGAAPTYLLNMITRQYRHLIVAKELLAARLSAEEIGRRLEIRSDFALRKVLEQAARYALPQLEAAYRRLLEADASIKRGIFSDELALDLLLEELSRIARWREATTTAFR